MSVTLTIEDGTIVAGANSYVSLADAQAIQAIRMAGQPSYVLFNAMSPDAQAGALVASAAYMDSTIQYSGRKYTDPIRAHGTRYEAPSYLPPTANGYQPYTNAPVERLTMPQPMGWPRRMACNREMVYFPQNAVPEEIRVAQAMLAVYLVGAASDDPNQAGVRVFRTDTFEIQFQQGYQPPTVPSWLRFVLNGYGRALNELGFKKIVR